MGSRRVVVTGLGIISCLGCEVSVVWRRLIDGHCGISSLTGKEYEQIPCRIAGQIHRSTTEKGEDSAINLEKYVSLTEQRNLSLPTVYALVAAEKALNDAGWKPQSENDSLRTGVAVGQGMVDLEEIVTTGTLLRDKGYRKVNPFFVPKILINMTAGHISMKYGLNGPNHAVSTACVSGLHSVGDAFRFIKNDFADVMVAGGVDATINPLAMAGFAKIRALSTRFNTRPHEASRPFDTLRDGFVMSEGCGLMVLEEFDHAMQRGAPIYAEVLGYGMAAEANHITAPREDGYGSYHSMRLALQEAKTDPTSVSYINAHATSTPLGDAAEIKAIRRLFGSHSKELFISSTKGATGHLLGAAGSLEAIFSILALHTGTIPPTINLENPDSEFEGLNLVPNVKTKFSESSDPRIALSNSLGFGGTTASICFSSVS